MYEDVWDLVSMTLTQYAIPKDARGYPFTPLTESSSSPR